MIDAAHRAVRRSDRSDGAPIIRWGWDFGGADDTDDLAKLSWMLIGRSLAELGRFEEANDEALRLLDAHPIWAREHSVEMIRRTWPQP